MTGLGGFELSSFVPTGKIACWNVLTISVTGKNERSLMATAPCA